LPLNTYYKAICLICKVVFVFTLLMNAYIAFAAMLPGLVTWAQTVPNEISCSICSQPEVQAALIQATEMGSTEITSLLPNAVVVLATATLNIIVVSLLLFAQSAPNK
jgi:hypothetical protein